jgi:putative oxidoreductase
MVVKILQNNTFTFISRAVVGFIFVVASIPKIADTTSFMKSIEVYGLFPYFIISITAIFLPWLELVVGVFLIFGILLRGSSLLSSVLFFTFSILITVTLLRGLSIDCGCFGSDGASLSWKRLIEDVGLLILSLQILSGSIKTNVHQS